MSFKFPFRALPSFNLLSPISKPFLLRGGGVHLIFPPFCWYPAMFPFFPFQTSLRLGPYPLGFRLQVPCRILTTAFPFLPSCRWTGLLLSSRGEPQSLEPIFFLFCGSYLELFHCFFFCVPRRTKSFESFFSRLLIVPILMFHPSPFSFPFSSASPAFGEVFLGKATFALEWVSL